MDNHSEHTINTELLAKYFSGEATIKEVEQVETWRDSSEKNKKEFNEYNLVWIDVKALQSDIEPSLQIDTNSAWNKLQHRIRAKVTPTFNWRYTLRIAAIFAIVLGSVWYLNIEKPDVKQNQLVASNEIKELVLSDSSSIVLNKNTQLTYPQSFNNNERRVKLKGEAHFSITPNKEKPFVIQVNKAIVKVLGTSFVVKEIEEDSLIRVMVETGKVMFAYKNENVILTKGMSASLDLRTDKITVDTKPTVNLGAWKSKRLLFKGTLLKEVLKQIEELYEVDIKVENPIVLNCELSATFDGETLEDVLMIIESTFGFEIDSSNDIIVIKGNGC